MKDIFVISLLQAGRETGKATGIFTRRGTGPGPGGNFPPPPPPFRVGDFSPPPPRSPTGAGNFPRFGAGPRRVRGIPAPLSSLMEVTEEVLEINIMEADQGDGGGTEEGTKKRILLEFFGEGMSVKKLQLIWPLTLILLFEMREPLSNLKIIQHLLVIFQKC